MPLAMTLKILQRHSQHIHTCMPRYLSQKVQSAAPPAMVPRMCSDTGITCYRTTHAATAPEATHQVDISRATKSNNTAVVHSLVGS